jgi:hypothetical protein
MSDPTLRLGQHLAGTKGMVETLNQGFLRLPVRLVGDAGQVRQ